MSLATLALSVMTLSAPARVFADEGAATTLDARYETSASEMGVSTLLGPRVGLSGPPTGFAVQLQYWHALDELWSLYGSLGLAVSGELELGSGAEQRSYGGSSTPSVGAGVRRVFELGAEPMSFYGRAGVLASFLNSGGFLGGMFGPELGVGLGYPLIDALSLVAESSVALGYAEYEGEGGLGLCFELAVGLQLQF
jgi:hypothetical protein